MPPKRTSQATDEVLPTKRLRPEEFFDNEPCADSTTESQPRRSSRAGRGRGGSIQHLRRLEDMQSMKPARQSTRNLDIATIGQEINAMAPSHPGAANDDDQSQIPSWVKSSSQLVQPTFAISETNRFGFKVPSQGIMSLNGGLRFNELHQENSVLSPSGIFHPSSRPSSRSSSLSSSVASRAGTQSTAPTSRVPSECGSNFDSGTARDNMDLDISLSQPKRRSSQLLSLAITNQPPASRTRPSPGLSRRHSVTPGSGRPDQDRESSECIPSESQHPVRSSQTQPSSIVMSHIDTGSKGSRDSYRVGSPVIDEVSPDEDERFAETIIRSKRIPASTRGSGTIIHAPVTTNQNRACSVIDGLETPISVELHGEDIVQHSGRQRNRLSYFAHDTQQGSEDEIETPISQDIRALGNLDDIVQHPGCQREQQISVSQAYSAMDEIAMASDARGDVEDVVAHHCQRNRPPRLPDNAQLMAIRERQVSSSRHDSLSRSNSLVPEVEAPTGVTPFSSCANTKSHMSRSVSGNQSENGDPSQLSFYPPTIRDILERAKKFSHCDLGSVNSFPFRVQLNTKASKYVNEAITEHRSQGLVVPDGWWPQYQNDITKLLWEDIASWHSSLKKKARVFIRERYEWDHDNRRLINADIAKQLLDRGAFLKHGVDKEGHTNNLAHPALSGLIIDFFYTGSNSIGTLFPEVFGSEVPRATVALAATTIKLALDEVAIEGKEVTFKRDIYADVYTDILCLMQKCDTNPIHREKTKALHVQWVRAGRNGSGTTATTTGFDIDLD